MSFILIKYFMYNRCYFVYTSDGDLLNIVLLIQKEAIEDYGKVDLPKVNITWYMALAEKRTPVAEFAYIEYHYVTDSLKNCTVYFNFILFFYSGDEQQQSWCITYPQSVTCFPKFEKVCFSLQNFFLVFYISIYFRIENKICLLQRKKLLRL